MLRPPNFESQFISSTSLSFLLNSKPDSQDLIATVQQYSWRGTFYRAAQLAACLREPGGRLANGPAQKWARRVALRLELGLDIRQHRVGKAIARDGRAILVHQRALHVLQALTLVHGDEGNSEPDDATLLMLVLAAGDFVPDPVRRVDPSRTTIEEAYLTTSFFGLQYDGMPDDRVVLSRFALIYSQPPPCGKLSTPARWEEVQREAFYGMTAYEYITGLAGPLYVLTSQMGTEEVRRAHPGLASRGLLGPNDVSPERTAQFCDDLAVDPNHARSLLRQQFKNGLPQSISLFARFPLVRFDEETSVLSSPWALSQHLRFGLWHRMLTATKKVLGEKAASEWPMAFGWRVEEWCREVARASASVGPNTGEVSLILSPKPGHNDEIEDVVLRVDDWVLLASVKTQVLGERKTKGLESAPELIEWLRDFLFRERPKERPERHAGKIPLRAGAVRLLDDKIRLIRRGKYASLIPADARIVPVIVTYEHLSDSEPFYHWLDRELERERLLQGKGVGRLTICSVDDFESLFGFIEHSKAALPFLERRAFEGYRRYQTDQAIRDEYGGAAPRPAAALARMDAVTAAMVRALAGGDG